MIVFSDRKVHNRGRIDVFDVVTHCYYPLSPPPRSCCTLFQAFEVFPSDNDMCFWKAIVTGPESTPYKGGCWMLNVYFPPSYPSVAPDIRFYTPIRHCNINAHGRVREGRGGKNACRQE